MKNLICILLLFHMSSLFADNVEFRHSEVEVTGSIHFYGDRYILKGVKNDYGKWFVLLESPLLEKINKELQLLTHYRVSGKVYTFNNTLYLLPSKFEETQQETKVIKKKSSKKKSSKRKKRKVSKKASTAKKTAKRKTKSSKKKKEEKSAKSILKLKNMASVKKVKKAEGEIFLEEKIKSKKLASALKKQMGIFAKYSLQEEIQTIKISRSKKTGCNIEVMAKLKKGRSKVTFFAKVKNTKAKVSLSEARKFVASLALVKSEYKMKKMQCLYLAKSSFTKKAREYLESFSILCLEKLNS